MAEIPVAVEAELARLRAENARLLRLLRLTPRQAAPPGPAQAAYFEVVVQVPAAHSQGHPIEEADSGWLSCSSVPWPGRRRVDCDRRSGETGGRRAGQGNGMAEPLPGKRRPARDGSFPAAIRRGAETLARVGK